MRFNEEKKERPQFQHDCDKCQFLGRYECRDYYDEWERYDLYQCEGKTVIARFGDDGPDFSSGLCFIESQLPLAVAYGRAMRLGVEFFYG